MNADALGRYLEWRHAVTQAGAQGYVQEAHLGRRRPGQPWTRHHAKDLLERAEALAGLPGLKGGDFHPFRRAWATARKHLPLVDVAAAGGWKDTETLLRHYMKPDSETLYAVMAEPRRVREVKVG